MNIIETVNLTKNYGRCLANDNINIKIKQGLITAIVGENGAGKSTLMNMFYGLEQPTSGEIYIKGKKVHFSSPLDAINCGLGMVHQHFKLVPSLTVFENIMLGIEENKKLKLGKLSLKTPIINAKEEKRKVQELIDHYKFALSPDDVVAKISIGAKQRVEILKMLYRNVNILIFDEPTAVLTPQEVEQFLESLRKLKSQGKTVILITHKLQEVMDVSDEVIVIKRGKVIGEMPTSETNPEQLADMMVGRKVLLRVNKKYNDVSKNKVAYRVEHLSAENSSGDKVLDDINFEIREGEVLGIAGVEGNGQSELVSVLTGLMECTEGSVKLYDKDVTNLWPRQLRESGIAMIPEDRYAQGLCRQMRISENLIAGYHMSRKFCQMGIMNSKAISQNMDRLIEKYDIRVGDKNGYVSELSGGNAQKIIIAREFDSDPKVLIASQPTRGVDVGSIEFIHNKILELSMANKAVLIVSSELSEVMGLSDRILVMYKGRIIGEVPGKGADSREIGLLMAGITASAK
ncbi:ABC transporter ATPase [[Clostridium] cellulosi]|jgi:nucleoside ABC transporter ATP-binding protein|uniref:ABC transporter ATPase n=1 Tax=[Clostridium] cellulosi TaxID=29343 RepID=A0A078KN70_9FIRM|nr:ABC transporter ATPase [[Clostridium] cellulosi]